jgi:hypothetical protein
VDGRNLTIGGYMPFYKREDEQLLVGGTMVTTPNVTLTVDTKDQYNYPQDGWYWFETLDDALAFYANKQDVNSITPRQIRLQLSAIGMRQAVEDYVAASSLDIKDWWEFSTYIERTSPLLINAATQLGMTSEQLDQFFIDASKL